MLHRFPDYSGAWEEVSGYLPEYFYCLASDQRGHGKNHAPEPVEDYKMELSIRDPKGIIEHFDGPVLVLGHVWGAAAACGLPLAYPKLVSRLIIMNCVHPILFHRSLFEDKAQNAASQYIPWPRRKGSETVLAENDFERLQAMFRQSMDMMWLSCARLGRYKLAWKDAARVVAMVKWYLGIRLRGPKPEDVPQNDAGGSF